MLEQDIYNKFLPLTDHIKVIDTLAIAKKLFPGQKNSLDALCKRYNVDNKHRELHGALLDANLLAQVYLAMTGGQNSFDFQEERVESYNQNHFNNKQSVLQKHQIRIITANSEELALHNKFMETISE